MPFLSRIKHFDASLISKELDCELLMQHIRVLVNVVNRNSAACMEISNDRELCLSFARHFVTFAQLRSDVASNMCSFLLSLMINLSESNETIRKILFSDDTFISTLLDKFCETNFVGSKDESPESAFAETSRNAFCAYCAILFGFLSSGEPKAEQLMKERSLTKKDFIDIIKEFLAFEADAGLLSRSSCSSVQNVLELLSR